MGGGGRVGGGWVGWRGGHVGEANGEVLVGVVILEWLQEEKGQQVGAGQRWGHIEHVEQWHRHVAAVVRKLHYMDFLPSSAKTKKKKEQTHKENVATLRHTYREYNPNSTGTRRDELSSGRLT